jgi:hypothetical protein
MYCAPGAATRATLVEILGEAEGTNRSNIGLNEHGGYRCGEGHRNGSADILLLSF